MPLSIDAFNKLLLITSPTTAVDAQEIADFVEDYMATPPGLVIDGVWPGFAGQGDILNPQGKIEDSGNPGVFSQIILALHPEWQIQFWGGSGYTRIFGGKFVGGVGDEPMKATGTAGDITILESPVDGVTVASGSGVTQQDKDDIENQIFARGVEAGQSFESIMRILSAMAAGNITQDANGNYIIRDINNTKDRIDGAAAVNGGRTVNSADGT